MNNSRQSTHVPNRIHTGDLMIVDLGFISLHGFSVQFESICWLQTGIDMQTTGKMNVSVSTARHRSVMLEPTPVTIPHAARITTITPATRGCCYSG
jgi:hypothetical protein